MNGDFSKGVTRRIAAARELFTAFTGRDASTLKAIELATDDVLFEVGKCTAISYDVHRNGKIEHYQHEFEKVSARPVLAASSDGRRLYLLAGAYRFTHRGIEDR